MLPTGWDRKAPIAAVPHGQPPRARVSATARASSRLGSGAAASSPSNTPHAARRATACASAPFGSAIPSACASPAADGAQNRPGRTNANSSRASNTRPLRPGTGTPSRRAVIAACATSTGHCSNRSRASGVRRGCAPVASATAARGPGSTTSAGARSRVAGVAVTPEC